MINNGFKFLARAGLLVVSFIAMNALLAANRSTNQSTSIAHKPSSIAAQPSSTIAAEPYPSDAVGDSAIDFTNPPPPAQRDPLEKFNRGIFQFNEFFDDYFLKPTSELYSKIMPKPLAKGISNAFSNLDMVPTVINDVLMLNFYQATNDIWRLGVNTTVGIGGLFDVASHIGLEPNTEDFGLTLAKWGWENSTYIVLPLMGPLTIRDGVGFPVNYYVFSVYPYIRPESVQYGIYALSVISRRADLGHYQEVMDTVAIDKYVFMRDAYLQRRNYLIQRNKELDNPYIGTSNLENVQAAKKEQEVQAQTRPFSSI